MWTLLSVTHGMGSPQYMCDRQTPSDSFVAHFEFVVMVVRDNLFIGTATTAPHGAFNTPLAPCAKEKMYGEKHLRNITHVVFAMLLFISRGWKSQNIHLSHFCRCVLTVIVQQRALQCSPTSSLQQFCFTAQHRTSSMCTRVWGTEISFLWRQKHTK